MVPFAPTQMVVDVDVTIGKGLTVIVPAAVPVQPLTPVPVTEYDVVPAGDAVRGFAVEPPVHTYVEAPAAVSEPFAPLQIVEGVTVPIGRRRGSRDFSR